MVCAIVLEKMENGRWFCQCEQVPGAVTQGHTIDEAKNNIKEAIALKKELTRKEYVGRRILRYGFAIL